MMRIAIFTDTYPPEINGVATSARNLFRTLSSHGQDVVVVTTNPYSGQFDYQDHVMRIPGLEMKKLYGYRAAGLWNKQAFDILEQFKPDVIHIQTDAGIGQFGFLAAGALHASTVYTFHTMMEDYTYYATKGHFERFARNVVRFYVRYKSQESDEFITPSDKIREYMRSIGVDAYINVIPTGIDFSSFRKENIDQGKVADLKKKYDLSPDTYVILSLGRVAKEKSIDVCLRGYAKYLALTPAKKTKMVIVGGGPALDDLKKLATDLGISSAVVFVGPVAPDDVPLYYQLGNMFVSASITETQGLTFMEAMASSLVLFVRYDDSLLGTIQDGFNGFYFLDETDFAKKLGGILTLDSAKLKSLENEALKAIDSYSLDKFYERVMEVYKRAIKKNW
jgi:1,2-diacylglycerol 3-alpha-glucosyltransferase